MRDGFGINWFFKEKARGCKTVVKNFECYIKYVLFGFGIVVSVDWKLGLSPAANYVMATFGSLYIILSQTLCQRGYMALLLINNGRADSVLLLYVCACACTCMFLCFVLWSGLTWHCLNEVGQSLIHFNILPACQARGSKHNATGKKLFGKWN